MKDVFSKIAAQPDWLKRELAEAHEQLGPVKILAVFADDLPCIKSLTMGEYFYQYGKRRQITEELLESYFGTATEPEGIDLFSNRLSGVMIANGERYPKKAVPPDHIQVKAKPDTTAILLPPQSWKDSGFLADTLKLPKRLFRLQHPFNFHQCVLRHELGHFIKFRTDSTPFTRSEDERFADLNVLAIKDKKLVNTFRNWRSVESFLNKLTQGGARYWNTLGPAFPTSPNASHQNPADLAMIELKQRCAAEIAGSGVRYTTIEETSVAFHHEDHLPLREIFSTRSPGSAALLLAAERVLQKGEFNRQLTFELAERTVQAARYLAPGVFATRCEADRLVPSPPRTCVPGNYQPDTRQRQILIAPAQA